MGLFGNDDFRELKNGCLRYPIGICEGSNYYSLLVYFDDNGKLTRANRCGAGLSCDYGGQAVTAHRRAEPTAGG